MLILQCPAICKIDLAWWANTVFAMTQRYSWLLQVSIIWLAWTCLRRWWNKRLLHTWWRRWCLICLHSWRVKLDGRLVVWVPLLFFPLVPLILLAVSLSTLHICFVLWDLDRTLFNGYLDSCKASHFLVWTSKELFPFTTISACFKHLSTSFDAGIL